MACTDLRESSRSLRLFAFELRRDNSDDPSADCSQLRAKPMPGKDKESNWLPAPKGQFFMAMRLYWPPGSSIGPGTSPASAQAATNTATSSSPYSFERGFPTQDTVTRA